jgi:hypothetical protein
MLGRLKALSQIMPVGSFESAFKKQVAVVF